MNIKILDSWLKEHLKTSATPPQIAEAMSLTSTSIEKIEKYNDDFLYDIEVTTNRPDLASVVGLAREAVAVLPRFSYKAIFVPPKLPEVNFETKSELITIQNDPKLVNRICAVVIDVTVKESPQYIKERLESSGIRSLNNVIDVTNYVMRTIGHPTHVFDYDRLTTKKLVIRESRKGEKISTLDGKEHILPGGDIVADDGLGHIVDLLGIMGLKNTSVTDSTKRILFFIDNNDPHRIRETSMSLGIRTEAAQLNEKELDPNLAMQALMFGISMFKTIAEGEIVGSAIDIFPNKTSVKKITVSKKRIDAMMGISFSLKDAASILESLGFGVEIKNDALEAIPPSFRLFEMNIPEDLIEEIARVYGYHNLPSELPLVNTSAPHPIAKNELYWEKRVKNALKYWGFTEVYTYPMVSELMYEGSSENAVILQNPLGEEFVYMRRTLIPSLLKVIEENKNYEKTKIFELANVYEKREGRLPEEIRTLAGVIKKPTVSFFEVKGMIEQLLTDLGIAEANFKALSEAGFETEVLIKQEIVGTIEVLDKNVINFELNFDILFKYVSLKKIYTQVSKFPPIFEDLTIVVDEKIPSGEIITFVNSLDPLIADVSLLDRYKDSRTFHIVYQNKKANLTDEEVAKIREEIIKSLKEKFGAKVK